ncbi:hypothetical protein pdam_00023902, partial [Pocillopora damicornis]
MWCQKVRNCTCDVEVLDYQWELTVKLSSLFKRDVFPANYSQIPKVKVPQEWENLRPIAYRSHCLLEITVPVLSDPGKLLWEVMMNPTDIDPQWDGVLLAEFASPLTVRGIKQFVTKYFTFFTKVKEVPQKILQVLESDFVENSPRNKPFL